MTWGQGRSSTLRARARKEIPYRCAVCGSTQDLKLDHIINLAEHGADDITNVQWLCRPHHDAKTRAEQRRGRNRWKRTAEKHPGLR
jgi:5-methylcytosine-specific restriction protein A